MTELTPLREQIEALDRELIDVLRRRMEVVLPIAEAKLDKASPFRDQPREDVVFERVRAMAVDAGLDPHRIEALYRVILEWSVARQQDYVRSRPSAPLRVAYQGVEGAYTHLAAQQRYAGRSAGALLTGHRTFAEAVAAVKSREADVALLPIENTTAGSITQTYDLLANGGVTITAEVVSHIEHCLLVLPGTDLAAIREVHSHPQALRQCAAFFEQHGWMLPIEAFDTAGSARMVRAEGKPELAAIASAAAAERYGLAIAARGIQTQAGNYTRFVEVALEAATVQEDVACRTSLLLELVHEPGALGRVLAAFAKHRVDLSKLESRPIVGEPWRYRFYLDIEGHAASSPVAAALDEARAECTELRVLGSYPCAGRPKPT
ncbi:MAG: prephenate dehydratase [Deltaproteobacteria bacterium]|nr:MAG: prephenate dehydratase [Deltaproteobacteria bacterium]